MLKEAFSSYFHDCGNTTRTKSFNFSLTIFILIVPCGHDLALEKLFFLYTMYELIKATQTNKHGMEAL